MRGIFMKVTSGLTLSKSFCGIISLLESSKISKILRDLEKKSVIKSGNFNKRSYDRTKWYTICDETILQKYTIDDAESKDGTLDSDETYTRFKTQFSTTYCKIY